MVSDDEGNMAATEDAFELLHHIVAMRLAAGRLTVVDATNVQPQSRKPLVALARKYHYVPVAIVFDLPAHVCFERNRTRTDRAIPEGAVRRQLAQLRNSIGGLAREGFRDDYRLHAVEDVDAAVVERQRVSTDLRDQHGPFDIIGDVHGCYGELVALLARLEYTVPSRDAATVDPGVADTAATGCHPDGRRAIFLGDLVDRGPNTPGVLRLAMGMVEAGAALCVPGNHDMKLLRALSGRKVELAHGLAETMAQMSAEPPEFVARVRAFLDGLVSHCVLDDGRLVVAHAGMGREMQGRASERVRAFALYGETTGEIDALGLPVRANWAEDYRGAAIVVYGHTPVPEPRWLHRTINIDTGCVFGGRLTALRYPELELTSVPAARAYFVAGRPCLAGA
jgi:protein phosphatase